MLSFDAVSCSWGMAADESSVADALVAALLVRCTLEDRAICGAGSCV
jgi:hypothetical protein